MINKHIVIVKVDESDPTDASCETCQASLMKDDPLAEAVTHVQENPGHTVIMDRNVREIMMAGDDIRVARAVDVAIRPGQGG